MKTTLKVATPLIILLTLLVGCASPQSSTTPAAIENPLSPVVTESTAATIPAPAKITVTDALGRTVEFDQYPTHILITGKASFMLLDAAYLFPEAQPRIFAYELRSQTGLDFVQTIFTEGTTVTVIDADPGPEQIAPLKPDLVMMKSYLKEDLGDQVEALGIKVIYLDLESPEQIDHDLVTLGQVFGNPERASKLVEMFDMAAARVTDLTGSLTDDQKARTLLLMYSNKGGEVAFSVPPGGWLQTQIVELAGGIPVWKDIQGNGWTVVTFEQIAAWDPEVIVIVDYKGKAMDVVTGLKADSNWKLLSAVKNNQLDAFPLDFQSWDQPDTRWTLGLTWLATHLQPELFNNVNMVDEVKSFYRDFYSLSDTVIDQKILPLVQGDFFNQP